MGQAIGTADAIATKYKTSPRGVYEKHIKELQDTLVKDGCRLMSKDGGMHEPLGALRSKPKTKVSSKRTSATTLNAIVASTRQD